MKTALFGIWARLRASDLAWYAVVFTRLYCISRYQESHYYPKVDYPLQNVSCGCAIKAAENLRDEAVQLTLVHHPTWKCLGPWFCLADCASGALVASVYTEFPLPQHESRFRRLFLTPGMMLAPGRTLSIV